MDKASHKLQHEYIEMCLPNFDLYQLFKNIAIGSSSMAPAIESI